VIPAPGSFGDQQLAGFSGPVANQRFVQASSSSHLSLAEALVTLVGGGVATRYDHGQREAMVGKSRAII